MLSTPAFFQSRLRRIDFCAEITEIPVLWGLRCMVFLVYAWLVDGWETDRSPWGAHGCEVELDDRWVCISGLDVFYFVFIMIMTRSKRKQPVQQESKGSVACVYVGAVAPAAPVVAVAPVVAPAVDQPNSDAADPKRPRFDDGSLIALMIHEGFKPLRAGVIHSLVRTTVDHFNVNPRVLTRTIVTDQLRMLFSVLPYEICTMTGNAISVKFAANPTSRYYRHIRIDAHEIISMFAIRLALYNNRGKVTLKAQFKGQAWPITIRRFNVLCASLTCDFPALSLLLRNAWTNYVNPVTV